MTVIVLHTDAAMGVRRAQDIADVEAAVTAVEAVTEFKTIVTADSFGDAEE